MTGSDQALPKPRARSMGRLGLLLILVVAAALFVVGASMLVKRQRAIEEMTAARDYLTTIRQNLLYLHGDEQSPAPGYLLNDKQTEASPGVRNMYLDLANCYSVAISDLEKRVAGGELLKKPQMIAVRLGTTSKLADESVRPQLLVEWLEIEQGESDAFAGLFVVDPSGKRREFPVSNPPSGRLWDVPNAYRQHVIILVSEDTDIPALGLSDLTVVLPLSTADEQLWKGEAFEVGLLLKDGSSAESVSILRAE